MAEQTRIEGIYTIRIENGKALQDFEKVTKALSEVRVRKADLNKESKSLIQQEEKLAERIRAAGAATEEEAKQLSNLKSRRAEVNRELALGVIAERDLASQSRELSNDLSNLTERGERFRDKIAQAFVTALEGSQIFQQLGARAAFLESQLSKGSAALAEQEQRIEDLNAQLRAGTITEERFTQEMADANAEIAKGKTANEALQRELEGTKQKSVQLEQEVKDLNDQYKQGLISQGQYREGLARIESETARAANATGSLTSKFDEFAANQGRELRSNLSSLALQYVGVGAAVEGVRRILGDALSTIREFETGLSSISALGGEYAANIEQIGEASKTAGIDLGFSANESLKAVEALAKAGVSVKDTLGGGLTGALTLAAAGSIEVSEAAEIAANAMTQFGLTGTDVTRIADLLANGANSATGEVGDFAQALKQSGLVAAQFGIPIEEAVGTLTAFASAGLLGSDAGTSFRTMLLRLANPSEEAKATMDRLGIATSNAKGEFVGIESLAGQLKSQLGGLTDEQRQSTLATIFGSDAIRAASVLYEQGSEGIAKWVDEVDRTGTAMEVAQKKTDNLDGDLKKLSSTYDALVLSGGKVDNVLRELVQGATNYVERVRRGTDETAKFSDKLKGLLQVGGGVFQILYAALDVSEPAKRSITAMDVVNMSLEEQEKKLESLKRVREKAFGDEAKTIDPIIEQLEKLVRARRATVDANKKAQQEEADEAQKQAKRQGEAVETVAEARERLKASIESERSALDALAATDADGIAAGEKRIGILEKELAAIDGKTEKQKDAARQQKTEAQAVAGSVADLEDRIRELQTLQAQSTESTQFATYQRQIEELEKGIDKIKNISATPMIDEAFGTDLEALPPATAVNAGTPMIDELEAEANRKLEELLQQRQSNELQGIEDFETEKQILQAQFDAGLIASREELNEKLASLRQEQIQKQLNDAQEVLSAAQNLGNGIIAIEQAVTANEVAELDKQIEARRIAGQSTADLEAQREKTVTDSARKAFQIQRALALAQIAVDTAKAIASLTSSSAANPSNSFTYGAAGAAQFAAGIIQIGANMAQAIALLSQKAPGFAGGGEVGKHEGGTVRPWWGVPVTRSNGDNVLVRSDRGFVTLKTGEKVLNDEQQKELVRRTYPGIWGDIGMPGHSSTGGMRAFRYGIMGAYADGGTIGLVTPTPSQAAISASELNAAVVASMERPVVASIVEQREVEARMSFREGASSL